MKTYIFLALFLGCAFSVKAHSVIEVDTVSGVRIEQQQILYHKDILGKVKTLPTKSINSNVNNFKIQIFENKGRLVAEYDIEVLVKQRKNQDVILGAQIKTLRDNVIHNGSNFLDFHARHVENSRDSIFQLEKVVKYLIAYNYL